MKFQYGAFGSFQTWAFNRKTFRSQFSNKCSNILWKSLSTNTSAFFLYLTVQSPNRTSVWFSQPTDPSQTLHFTSAWASSLSWCGNLRSTPPVWMSSDLPHIAEAITEHSMCQPGRPRPHGESHQGSPSFDLFQRAKSFEERFSFSLSSDTLRSPEKRSNFYESEPKRMHIFSAIFI